MLVYVNGKLVPDQKASVSIQDHGFLYGDGVYETLRVYHGDVFLLHEHLRRLNNSLLGIHLSPPLSLIGIGRAIQKTVQANKHKEAAVRLTITRGPGRYGFDPRSCKKPTLIITSMPFKGYPADLHRKGMTVAVVSIRRNSPASLPPSVKSTSCLNGILAKIESLDVGANEGIMLTHDDKIAEGTVSNVFIVRDGKLFTPKLDGNFLPGVTREWVCQLARRADYAVTEKTLVVSALASADEVFLTSTLMEIMPVSRIVFNHASHRRSVRVGPHSRTSGFVGPVTLDLMKRFRMAIGSSLLLFGFLHQSAGFLF